MDIEIPSWELEKWHENQGCDPGTPVKASHGPHTPAAPALSGAETREWFPFAGFQLTWKQEHEAQYERHCLKGTRQGVPKETLGCSVASVHTQAHICTQHIQTTLSLLLPLCPVLSISQRHAFGSLHGRWGALLGNTEILGLILRGATAPFPPAVLVGSDFSTSSRPVLLIHCCG